MPIPANPTNASIQPQSLYDAWADLAWRAMDAWADLAWRAPC
ncbi:hypothetical protein LTSEMIN_0955 [Salmonella enterica subsp. enterica serovar Minnesota str. A4-603]|nr:hypothetical protein LTSEMIN_0955 [Salmonella enterica subsp. enterica serovar Minnesota str. A4-603]